MVGCRGFLCLLFPFLSQILVHELSLLLVGLDDLIQSSLSDHDRVGETSSLVSASVLSSLLVEVLVIKFNHLILLLELQLQFLNDILEFLLFLLMLSLESNDLIIGFLSDFADGLVVLVLEFSLLLGLFDGLGVPFTLPLARGKFLSKKIDLPPILNILSFCHVKAKSFVVNLLLSGVYLDFSHFIL